MALLTSLVLATAAVSATPPERAEPATELFALSPGSGVLPAPSRDARFPAITVDYPVMPNIRALARAGRPSSRLVVAQPNGDRVTFRLKNFLPVKGFLIDEQFDVVPDPAVRDDALEFHWYGVGDGVELWLSHSGGDLRGRMTVAPSMIYTFERVRGQQMMRAVNPTKIPQKPEEEVATFSLPVRLKGASQAKFSDMIDVLVVHTPEAVTATGQPPSPQDPDGEPGTLAKVHALVTDSITHMNQSLLNSNVVSFQLRNVMPNGQASIETSAYVGEQNDCYGAGICSAIDEFSYHRRWARANLGALRNTYAADLVVLVVGDSALCGVAYTQRNNCGAPAGEPFECTIGTGYDAFAYAAVSAETDVCPLTTLTFAHEVGHQFGMEHNPDGANQTGASYVWSYGRRYDDRVEPIGARTIMANSCFGDSDLDGIPDTEYCAIQMHYANPTVNFGAFPTHPTGSFTADGFQRYQFNARTAALLAPTMADFRGPVVSDRLFRHSFEALPDIVPSP